MIIDTQPIRRISKTARPAVHAKLGIGMPPKRYPFLRQHPWILGAACWTYLLMVVAIWMIIRFTGDRWWFGTLLLIVPRWPYALPLLGLAPWAIRARRWRSLPLLGLAATILLFPILGFRVSLPRGGPERGDVRVLSCNVHRQHLDAADLDAYVAEVRPDIVAIQGWSGTGHEALFAGDGWSTHREGELFVASRFPISRVTPIDLDDGSGIPHGQMGAAAVFELQTPKGPINMINLHLASPHASLLVVSSDSGEGLADNVARRWRESDVVRGAAETIQGPLFLTGDFNTTDDSPILRDHWGEYVDAFSERGFGFGYTYLVSHTQIRIDHVLANPSWEVLHCWLGPDIGSPHHPLVADLMLR